MATLSVQGTTPAGAAPTYAAVSASDQYRNSGREIVHVKNAGASPCTVTINSQKLCDQGVTHDLTVSVPAGEERRFGPFDTVRFNDANDMVVLDFSYLTTVTVGIFKNQ